MLANEDMARVESEAGIIATLIHHLVVRVWGYFLTSFVISVVSNCTR